MSHLFLVYDSICGTAFYSQVLQPIFRLASKQGVESVLLVSFEVDLGRAKLELDNIGPSLPKNVEIRIIPRVAFWGGWTLSLAANHLEKYFKEIRFEAVVCRGIFAAEILSRALSRHLDDVRLERRVRVYKDPVSSPVGSVEVLIPGLVREEIFLIDKRKMVFKRLFLYFKACIFSFLARSVEASVFSKRFLRAALVENVRYLASSFSLARFLAEECEVVPARVSVLPNPKFEVDLDEKLEVRVAVRRELGIENDVSLYCYSGGMQSWQSFDLNVEKFLEVKKSQQDAHLLVLTRDLEVAQQTLSDFSVSDKDYTLLSLEPDQVHRYLLACDFGLLLREHNLVNWTARPIKALEYLQAGLLIIHNNSIEWVIRNS